MSKRLKRIKRKWIVGKVRDKNKQKCGIEKGIRFQKTQNELINNKAFRNALQDNVRDYINQYSSPLMTSMINDKDTLIFLLVMRGIGENSLIPKKDFCNAISDLHEQQQVKKILMTDKEHVWVFYRKFSQDGEEEIFSGVFGYEETEFKL